jgi:hypothetical protein
VGRALIFGLRRTFRTAPWAALVRYFRSWLPGLPLALANRLR